MGWRRPLSIHQKTFAVFAISFICLILALHWLTSHFLLGGFRQVEDHETRLNVSRVQAALQDSVHRLDTTAGDWAGWDEAYKFVAGKNPTYVKDSLTPESIGGIGIDFLVFLDKGGRIYFGTGYNPHKKNLCPLPEGLEDLLRPGNLLLTHNTENEGHSGLVSLPGGVWMISARPILNSEKKGPVHGTLVMGQRLDRTEVARLSLLTELSFTLHPTNTLKEGPADSSPIVLEPLSPDVMLGRTVLADVYGRPKVELDVKVPRSTWKQGQDSLQYVLLTMISLCLACGAISLCVIERVVLGRLRLLAGQVRTVTTGGDFSRRISWPGMTGMGMVPVTDELGTLALAVNDMLAAVERSGQSLQESETRFRTFMDNSPAVAFIKDSEGRMVYVNATYERRLNRRAEDVYGKTDFDLWPEAVAKRLRSGDLRMLAEGRALQLEDSTPTPDGMADWITFKFPLTGLNGETLVAGMAIDITERKAIERMKSEFVSVVSHELRTPVTSIRGALGLVLGGVSGDLSPKSRELLRIACDNSDRLTQLLNDILDMQKIEAGKMALVLEPLCLEKLVRKSLNMNEAYANAHRVAFVLEDEAMNATIQADGDRFLQVMANLLSNAAKFSSGPEVRIGIERFTGSNDQPWVRVSVNNQGPMVPREFHARIFTRFAQADASSTRAKGGTGLGLSISKAIIERMGGRIGFSSEEESGTTFYFELPEDVRPVEGQPVETALL